MDTQYNPAPGGTSDTHTTFLQSLRTNMTPATSIHLVETVLDDNLKQEILLHKSLQSLTLISCNLTNSDARDLQECFPRLVNLTLRDNMLTNIMLFSNMPEIVTLDLANNMLHTITVPAPTSTHTNENLLYGFVATEHTIMSEYGPRTAFAPTVAAMSRRICPILFTPHPEQTYCETVQSSILQDVTSSPLCLPKLQKLILANNMLTELNMLSALHRSLTYLDISSNKFESGAAVSAFLPRYHPGPQWQLTDILMHGNTSMNAGNMAHALCRFAAWCPAIRMLNISCNQLWVNHVFVQTRDEHRFIVNFFDMFAQFKTLERLFLFGNNCTSGAHVDAMLRSFARCPKLVYVHLREAPYMDADFFKTHLWGEEWTAKMQDAWIPCHTDDVVENTQYTHGCSMFLADVHAVLAVLGLRNWHMDTIDFKRPTTERELMDILLCPATTNYLPISEMYQCQCLVCLLYSVDVRDDSYAYSFGPVIF